MSKHIVGDIFRCPDCGEALHRDNFYKVKSARLGVDSSCKQCKEAARKRNLATKAERDLAKASAPPALRCRPKSGTKALQDIGTFFDRLSFR